ncbi:MAG: hypothetical protein COB15_07475 [Flavobacteriales bacterium]|nr:MAG: hypothetical protein COB15_07475 [Flavobacteriales bacterium]
MIGFVRLNLEELPVLKEIMEIEEEDGKGFFIQPCKNYCDGCTIYSNRPKQCDNFKCELLKAHEEKKLDFDSAIGIINELKQKKLAIEKKLSMLQFELKSQSFCFKMIELNTLLQKNKDESVLKQKHLELISDLKQLDNLLTKRFGLSILPSQSCLNF